MGTELGGIVFALCFVLVMGVMHLIVERLSAVFGAALDRKIDNGTERKGEKR